jgi:hypothetical protein
LTLLFTAVLLNSLRGRRSCQVTGLSILFMISDISLAVATVIFKKFQSFVLKGEWLKADKTSKYFNVIMCAFVMCLAIPHWLFFSKYFECCCTMPYFYEKKRVPLWLMVALFVLNLIMLGAQIIGPIMVFIDAQLVNNYYFLGFASPTFNPLKFDFQGATKWENGEKFWLNFLVVTQLMDGIFLLISIVAIRCIIKKVGVNNKMVD